MKAVTIAVLLFSIQLSFAIINVLGGFEYAVIDQGTVFNDMQEQAEGDYSQAVLQESTESYGLGDMVKALPRFILLLAWSIVAVPYLFMQFGTPLNIALLVSMPVYFIYGLAIIQFISNRSTKGMG